MLGFPFLESLRLLPGNLSGHFFACKNDGGSAEEGTEELVVVTIGSGVAKTGDVLE